MRLLALRVHPAGFATMHLSRQPSRRVELLQAAVINALNAATARAVHESTRPQIAKVSVSWWTRSARLALAASINPLLIRRHARIAPLENFAPPRLVSNAQTARHAQQEKALLQPAAAMDQEQI
jgi:hypothetical protein